MADKGSGTGRANDPKPQLLDFSNDPAFRAAAAAAAAATNAGIGPAMPGVTLPGAPTKPTKATPATTQHSAYSSPGGTYAQAGSSASSSSAAAQPQHPPRKVRTAGGQIWEDKTLDEWDESDFRLFVGDLANDTTDDLLTRTFARYPSFLKARVVRDKRTGKSRGYGFVSFRNPEDFARAFRELNGKYIGHRPCKLRKSTWKDRNMEEQDPGEVRELKRLRMIATKGKT